MVHTAGPAAALTGVPVGIQAEGAWIGRRQLFVRFANEGETATLYTAPGLVGELDRVYRRSRIHSICASGRDSLGNASYLCTVLTQWTPPVPVMVGTDGQRPEGVDELGRRVTMVQITQEVGRDEAPQDRAMQTLQRVVAAGYQHALVLGLRADTQDDRVVALVTRAHEISAGTAVVLHPPAGEDAAHGRRWLALMERVAAAHEDVRFLPRLTAPTGMR